MYSYHVKAKALRNIVCNESTDCDSKVDQIRGLLNLPPENENSSEGGNIINSENVEVENPVESEIENSRNKILADFSPNEKKLAVKLLDEIQKQKLISWDFATSEVIINNEKIYFSDLRLLIV